MGTTIKGKTKSIAPITAQKVELDEDRMLRVIATAPTLDRDLEVIDTQTILVPIKPTGLKYAPDLTPEDEIDLPLLIDHKWELEKQAGSVRRMYMTPDGKLESVNKLSTVDNGERVYTLAKEKHLGNSFSIGYSLQNATFTDGVWYNIELTELSAVFKGSNRDAIVTEVKSMKGNTMTQEELKAKKLEAEKLTKEIADAELASKTASEIEAEKKAAEDKAAKDKEAEDARKAEEAKQAEDAKKEEETKKAKEAKMTKEQEIASKQVVNPPVPKEEAKVAKKTQEVDKYDFAAKQFVAWVNKDTKKLAELNQQAIDSYSDASKMGSKATYLNTGVTADGGAIVPNAQLLADVYTVLANYSTVANDLRVITLTEGDSLDIATLVQDVIMTEVNSEGGTKPVTKPVFGDDNVALREFAGIAIITKKLVRQAAINVFDILRDSFARAIAQKRAELALTDASSGIVNQVGVVEVESTGSGVEDITWGDIRSMPYAIPVSAIPGSKYYVSRELVAHLDGLTDENGVDLDIVTLDGEQGLTGRFKNGFRFAVEEELGQGDEPHAVFGAMGRFGILLRQGTVESETFDTGIVVDGSSVSHNLLQQNKLAHRVAFYENVGYPLPGAFAVLVDESSS